MSDFDICLCGHKKYQHGAKGKCGHCTCDDYEAEGKPDADLLGQQLSEQAATIAQLRQDVLDARRERDAWQLDSMNAVYAAQQFDPLLYLQGDTGAADVMKRVLERLRAAQP